jgi:hypothetical protein
MADDLADLKKRIEALERGTAKTDRDTDRKLTLREHMHCQIVVLPSVDGDDTDVDIRLDPQRIKGRPLGVRCLEARVVSTGTAASYGGSVQWQYYAPDARTAYVRIVNFPGLASGTKHAVTFAVDGG